MQVAVVLYVLIPLGWYGQDFDREAEEIFDNFFRPLLGKLLTVAAGELDPSRWVPVAEVYDALNVLLDANEAHWQLAEYRINVLGELYQHMCGRRAATGKELSTRFAEKTLERYMTERMSALAGEMGTGHHRRRCYKNVVLHAP